MECGRDSGRGEIALLAFRSQQDPQSVCRRLLIENREQSAMGAKSWPVLVQASPARCGRRSRGDRAKRWLVGPHTNYLIDYPATQRATMNEVADRICEVNCEGEQLGVAELHAPCRKRFPGTVAFCNVARERLFPNSAADPRWKLDCCPRARKQPGRQLLEFSLLQG